MSGEKLRATKIGIAYAVEQKQEQNYDREEAAGVPAALKEWINGVVGSEHDPIPDHEWKAFNNHLRDGVMLCKLINILLKQAGKSAVSFQKKVMSPFVAMTNIENFNKGLQAYGLPKEATFQSGDLYEVRKAGFYNVASALHQLASAANANCVMPAYLGDQSKSLDRE